MHYIDIMDTLITSEICTQLLDRFNIPSPTTPQYPLPNRRSMPPQDWLLRLRPRITQQLQGFLQCNLDTDTTLIDYLDNINTEYESTNNDIAMPRIMRQLLSCLNIYRQLFAPIIHDQHLTYRVSKFILACHGFTWLLDDTLNPSDIDIDTEPKWVFFIALIYGILDHNVDNQTTEKAIDNTDSIPTAILFTYIDGLLNDKPQPHISLLSSSPLSTSSSIYIKLQYVNKLWHEISTPWRAKMALRALECERKCWHLQTNNTDNKYNVPRNIVAQILVEKGISTALLCYKPRRSATIQQWRQLYWTGTLMQVLDDGADACEDIQMGLASTTGIALCKGDIPTYIAASLDTISYVYYNYELFADSSPRLAVLQQVMLYGVIKTSLSKYTTKLSLEWINTYVIPNMVIDIKTLYSIKSKKPQIKLWIQRQLYQ